MRINNITPYSTVKTAAYNRYQSQPAFQGILPSLNKTSKKTINYFLYKNRVILGVPEEKLQVYAASNNADKLSFFTTIAKRINEEHYFGNAGAFDSEKDLSLADRLFKAIDKPGQIHKYIVRNRKYSIPEVEQLLGLINENPENLKALKNLLGLKKQVDLPVHYSAGDLINILASGKAEKLNKNLKTYKSYIILKNQAPDFSKNLLEELDRPEPSFNVKKLDTLVKVKNGQNPSAFDHVIDENLYGENYNKYAINLLSNPAMNNKYRAILKNKTAASEQGFFKYLLETTNKDNVDLRNYYMTSTPSAVMEKQNWSSDTRAFFERLDSDKDFKKIYKYITKNHEVFLEPLELMEYADMFSSKVLADKVKTFAKFY